MNVQNAKELTITEGQVRTIHDKNNQLLWGAVGFDTTYRGDTTQQTYSGKNLSPYAIYDAEDGRILNMPDLILAAGTYTISFDLDSFELGTNSTMSIYMSFFNSSGTNVTGDKNLLTIASDTSLSRYNYTFEASEDVHYTTSQIRITTSAYNNGGRCKISNIQIESGSSPSSYEPYVGGVPAPNPSYPQNVNVVTGVQTITLSDDDSTTQNYIVDLGTLELAKIGDYQDYIYKSGDDWYVHKEIGKVVYNGTENWSFGTASALRVLVEIETNMEPYTTNALCSHLVYGNTASASQDNVFNIGSNKVYAKATAITTSADSWKTWLATHNVSLYYQLTTPTDTQIIDTVLLSQLNAIHEFLTRYGYNSSVTGNLPLIINQTSL